MSFQLDSEHLKSFVSIGLTESLKGEKDKKKKPMKSTLEENKGCEWKHIWYRATQLSHSD
jgi:hypothetical protein